GSDRSFAGPTEAVQHIVRMRAWFLEKPGQVAGIGQYPAQHQRCRHAGADTAGDVVLDAVADAHHALPIRIAGQGQRRLVDRRVGLAYADDAAAEVFIEISKFAGAEARPERSQHEPVWIGAEARHL